MKIGNVNSKYMRIGAVILSMLLSLGILSGCASHYIAAVEMAFEDRSAEDVTQDTEITTGIKATIADEVGAEAGLAVKVNVYEQVVMLTGKVETGDTKAAADRIASSYANVKKVISEIKVVPAPKEGEESEGSFVDDFLIETTIQASAAADNNIHHTNWRWSSVDGTVYLFGRSLSPAEKNTMINMVQNVSDVKNVVDHSYTKALPAS